MYYGQDVLSCHCKLLWVKSVCQMLELEVHSFTVHNTDVWIYLIQTIINYYTTSTSTDNNNNNNNNISTTILYQPENNKTASMQ